MPAYKELYNEPLTISTTIYKYSYQYILHICYQLWKNDQIKIEPNISVIKEKIQDNSKLVYFAADEQTKIDWPEIPCYIVDVASKPYFEVFLRFVLFNYLSDSKKFQFKEGYKSL